MFITPPRILSASERYNNISSVLGKSDQSDDISVKNAKTNNIQANLIIYTKQIKRWELCSCNNTRSCKQSFRFQQHQSKKKRFHRIIWRRKGSKEVALIWFKNNADNINNTLLIRRDSKSLFIAILGKNSRVTHISSLLKYICAKLTSQWILGHSKVTGNELADKAAKETVCLSVVQFPIALSSALNFIKNVIKDGSITNNRTRKVYAKYHTAIDSAQIHSRHDQVLIARLRSGHPQSLRGYLHHLNSDIDPVCPKCHKEDHILKHWLMISPIGGNLRQQEFQCHRGTLKWLATHSKAVATSARKTLVNFYI